MTDLDKFEAREVIAKHWLSMSLMFILPYAGIYAFQMIFYPLIGIIFPEEEALKFFLNSYGIFIDLFIQNLVATIIPLLILSKIYKKELSIKYEKKYEGKFYHWILFYPLMTVVSSSVGALFEQIFAILNKYFGIEQPVDTIADSVPAQTGEIIAFFISIVIIAPILEELLFRGLILKAFRGMDDLFAAVMSGVMFGLYHGNFYQAPYTTTMGILLGVLTLRANSIKPAIFIHMLNNFISTISSYSDKMAEGGSVIGQAFHQMSKYTEPFMLIVYLLSIVSIFILFKDKQFSLEKSEVGGKLIFKNAQFIIFVIACIIVFNI